MGRHKKQATQDEPNDAEMRAAERYAERLKKRADRDIEELRKQLQEDDDEC